MKKIALTMIALFGIFLASATANKTAVEIKAPAEVKVGTEITIVIKVEHKGNSKGHHTDWVSLKINGKEVKKWEYPKTALPPSEIFTVEYKIIVTEEMTIVAQGNCNLHGSAGPQTMTVKTNG